LYYTVSDIITPIGGRPVYRFTPGVYRQIYCKVTKCTYNCSAEFKPNALTIVVLSSNQMHLQL